MTTYNSWAKFYDQIYGERSDSIDFILKFIKKHKPDAKTVLDLACGTGIITNGLSSTYEVEGLDLSQGQIDVAKQNYPNIPFHQMDMSTFNLNKKFDVILCLFNSINHLSDYNAWEATFKCVKKHLNNDGVFIFDVSTPKKLERLSSMTGATLNEFGDANFRVVTVSKEGSDLYNWNIKVFENMGNGNYILHKDTITELAVPLQTISNSLETYFQNVETQDAKGNSVMDETSKVFFICK